MCHNKADESGDPRHRSSAGRNQVRKLSLFGSILTERLRPDSDEDVLVEFETDAAVTYLDLARMEQELSTVIGRKVDLRTPQELSRYLENASSPKPCFNVSESDRIRV